MLDDIPDKTKSHGVWLMCSSVLSSAKTSRAYPSARFPRAYPSGSCACSMDLENLELLAVSVLGLVFTQHVQVCYVVGQSHGSRNMEA